MSLKVKSTSALLIVLFLSFEAAAQERDVSQFKESNVSFETSLLKLRVAATQPQLVALCTDNCSTFDLAKGGVEHLMLGAQATVCEVWPLKYYGSVGDIHFYQEEDGTYNWIWVITPDHIYFIADGTLRDFGKARILKRIP